MTDEAIIIINSDDEIEKYRDLKTFMNYGGPLRRNLDYQSIARKTFLVEQLPDGALPIYDKE